MFYIYAIYGVFVKCKGRHCFRHIQLYILLSFFDIAAISSEDSLIYSMKVFCVLWPLTCIIWSIVYRWLRCMLVILGCRAVWLVTQAYRGTITLPLRSVSASLPSFFNASFCFIVSLVGTFSLSVGTVSDKSFRVFLMQRFNTRSLAIGLLLELGIAEVYCA